MNPELCSFSVVSGTALSSISQLTESAFFIHFSFVEESWLPAKKFMLSDICRIHFHIRSNAGMMAGNGDPMNQ